MSYLLSPKLLKMGESIYFQCPGCDMLHPYRVEGEAIGPKWAFNGNADKPSFTPSLLVDANRSASRCHLYVTDGRIQYLNDCHHVFAGHTIDLVDIPDLDVWLDNEV